ARDAVRGRRRGGGGDAAHRHDGGDRDEGGEHEVAEARRALAGRHFSDPAHRWVPWKWWWWIAQRWTLCVDAAEAAVATLLTETIAASATKVANTRSRMRVERWRVAKLSRRLIDGCLGSGGGGSLSARRWP